MICWNGYLVLNNKKGAWYMANMAYCRFENTFKDLTDCYNHLDELTIDLSDTERKYRIKLLNLCKLINDEYGINDK